MRTGLGTVLLRRVCRFAAAENTNHLADAELLGRFLAQRDEAAFEALVRRHGPMVWGICRRLLRDEHAAEDAFQAVFLVLVRSAASIRKQASIASWLHGVARRLALKANARANRQRECESRVEQKASLDPADEVTLREAQAILDEELARLPEKYRDPIILCCLEGLARDEAAARLGWSATTLKSRLEEARDLLRKRLTRRGLTLPATLSAAFLAPAMSPAAITPLLLATTCRAAELLAAGKAAAIAPQVFTLADAAMRSAPLIRLKLLAIFLLALTLAAGAGLAVYPEPAAQTPDQVRPAPQHSAKQPQAGVDLFGDPLPQGAMARLGTLRWRADGEVRMLAYSPDGKTVAAVAGGGVYLFDASTGRVMRRIRPSEGNIVRIAFSPDGKRLACACWGLFGKQRKNVLFWDLRTHRKTLEVDAKEVQWLGWSGEGKPIALCHSENAVLLRELTSGKEKQFKARVWPEYVYPDVSMCAYSSRGNALAVVDTDAIVHVWDTRTGAERFTCGRKGEFVNGLAFSSDGRILAIPTSKGVQLWDAVTGKKLRLIITGQKHHITIAVSPDDKTLVSISGWEEARFWDLAGGRELARTGGKRTFAKTAAFSPDGKTLATAEMYSGTIHLWDTATGALRHEPTGHTNRSRAAAFSPDGRRVATGGTDGTIFIWDPTKGRQLTQIRRPYRWLRGYAFSADGRLLYSLCDDDKLSFWDTATGQEVQTIKIADPDQPDTRPGGWQLSLSPDRKTLVAMSLVKHNLFVTGWDMSTRKQLFRRHHPRSSLDLAVSADLRLLAVSQGGGPGEKGTPATAPMRLEALTTGEHLRTFPTFKGQMWPVAFSPDGRLLVSIHSDPTTRRGPTGAPRYKLRLWEVATAAEVLALPANGANLRVAFSPDGRLLAFAGHEQEIIVLWDLRQGQEHQRFKGFDSGVAGLTFSPDGTRLVSSLTNTSVLIWEVAAVRNAAKAGNRDGAALARLWADLGGDARKAFVARGRLASAPEQVVRLLKEQLRPAQPADARRLQQLVADLNSSRFKVRDAARKELEELDDLATKTLQRALAGKLTLETRRRIEALLARQHEPVTRPELLRALRAVAILEDIARPEARAVLRPLADGAPGARLTEQAKGALERLAQTNR